MKINKLNESMIPSQEILDDCLDDYLHNAFGYNGVEDYVATQYPNHPSEWQARICDYLKQHKHESLDVNKKQLKESDYDEFFELQDIIGSAINSIGGDMDDITGGITSNYDEDRLLISFYSTTSRKDARKFSKNFGTVIENALSQTRFNEISYDENHTFAYHMSKYDIYNLLGPTRGAEFMKKYAMFEIAITAYGKKLEEAMNHNELKEWNEFSDDDFEDDIAHSNVYGGDSRYCRDCGAIKEYDEDGFAYCPECDPKQMNEASYGGAYDIADDQYFTKEQVVEFGEECIDTINTIGYSKVSFVSAYVENGNIEVTAEWDGNEVSATAKIDMRRIRKPSDLYRACGKVITDKLIKELTDVGADMGPHMSDQDYPMEEDLKEGEMLPIQFLDLGERVTFLSHEIAKNLDEYFRENKLHVQELHYNNVRDCIEFDINWSDWKHEHLRSKWLIEEFFKGLDMRIEINSWTTEEDGSDTYSAHYQLFATE